MSYSLARQLGTSQEKVRLYAIAVERCIRGQWIPEIEYLHAYNQHEAEAKYKFMLAKKHHGIVRVVGIAPAVGFFVNDSHGEKLTAE